MKITNELKEIIIARYLLGESAYGIAKDFNLHGSSILSMLQKSNIQLRSKKLTNLEQDEILNRYSLGESYQTIANNLNRDIHTIQRYIKSQNIKIRSTKDTARKYGLNHNYFDIIDTEDKAYFLGLLYADGSNSTKYGICAISLIDEDSDILLKLAQHLQTEKPLSKPKRKKESHRQQSCLTITSRKISDSLNKLGCVPAKSLILKFPTEEQVPTHLLTHWLRGMWDGDGSYYITKRNLAGCNITSTKNICEGIQKLIKESLNIETTIHKRKNSCIHYITLCSVAKVKKFIEWIYQDSTIYLQRKYNKANLILEMIKPKDVN